MGESLKTPTHVVYLGAQASYSHLAATRFFQGEPGGTRFEGLTSFRALLDAVGQGRATHCVLPIENTTAGSINDAYDLLAQSSLSIVGEELQPVRHCLVAARPLAHADISVVYSHPQALAQCGALLERLKPARAEATSSTTAALEQVKKQGGGAAAIGSAIAADRLGLTLLEEDVADAPNNHTRMVIVTREPQTFSLDTPCKTSLALSTKHEEGALLKCLGVFHDHRINLTKLESRPRRGQPWEYIFYLDFEGNVADPDTAQAMEELQSRASWLRVLGSYPSKTLRTP